MGGNFGTTMAELPSSKDDSLLGRIDVAPVLPRSGVKNSVLLDLGVDISFAIASLSSPL